MEKYGRLKVLENDGRYKICECECGKIKRIRTDHLKSGATISCGCVGQGNSAKAKRKHGMSDSRLFSIWLGMIDRCRNDRSGNYGKRGIKVCERWEKSFVNFYEDMGEPPSPYHSIERNDVNGDYEPSNCRWATREEQANNTRKNTFLTYNGETKTMAQWARDKNIKPATICNRLYVLGWTLERTLTEKPQKRDCKKPWIEERISRSAWYRKNKQ
jgi:hypothetical protein